VLCSETRSLDDGVVTSTHTTALDHLALNPLYVAFALLQCKLMDAHLHHLTFAFKGVKFAKFNCGTHEDFSTGLRIRSLPTFRCVSYFVVFNRRNHELARNSSVLAIFEPTADLCLQTISKHFIPVL